MVLFIVLEARFAQPLPLTIMKLGAQRCRTCVPMIVLTALRTIFTSAITKRLWNEVGMAVLYIS